MQTSALFSIYPTSQQGDVYLTEFEVGVYFSTYYKTFSWDFGDGTFSYNVSGTSHVYQLPGIYTISLSAWSAEGFISTDSTQIRVDFVYPDKLTFKQIPSTYGFAGLPPSDPFILNVISSKIDQPISLIFQAHNTKSIPYYAVLPKWKHITPHWRFVDFDTNEIIENPYTVNTQPVYKNGQIVAVSGNASFYYIDDLPTVADEPKVCPLLLSVTLSTLNFTYHQESLKYPYYSYANSDVAVATTAWQINETIPTRLKVTENYLNDIFPVKWSNVPIPILISCQFNPIDLVSFSNSVIVSSCDVLAYPKTNLHGSIYPVKVVLSADGGSIIPEHLYTVEVNNISFSASVAPQYFKREDDVNNLACGYIFTTVTPLTSFSSNIVISVSTVSVNELSSTQSFGFPYGMPIESNVFISNPLCGVINKINSTLHFTNECTNVNYYNETDLLTNTTRDIFSVPVLKNGSATAVLLSGESAIYSMSYDPIKSRLYAADSDQDTILVFDSDNTLIKTLQLSSFTAYGYNTPSCISIDAVGNVWVSLYSNQWIMKFDPNMHLLLSAVPTVALGVPISTFGGTSVSPTTIETDSSSNVWVCYGHPLSSMLVKFDGSTGNELFAVSTLSFSSIPVSLAIDVDDNIWVACYASNTVQCHDSNTGSMLQQLTDFIHPSYIAMDRNNRVWITHGYNLFSVFDSVTNQLSSWRYSPISKTVISTDNIYTSNDIFLALTENEIWGGLCVDVYDKVWIIDSDTNTAGVFSAQDIESTFSTMEIQPTPTTINVIIGGAITAVTLSNRRSAQAGGDWSGNRWFQKYGRFFKQLRLHGVSKPFKIYDVNKSYNITKINEEFDMANHIHSLALPEILHNNENFFEKFLPAVVGNGNPTQESIGRVVYEKIANYIDAHADFNTVNIKQLISFAEQMAVEPNGYGVDFPNEVIRLLDIFSVDKFFLRGKKNTEIDILNKIGDELTLTSTITAGQYIILRDKLYQKFNIVYVNQLSGIVDTYPLSGLVIDGAREPRFINYNFYEFNDASNGYMSNIINWDSSYTSYNDLTGSAFFNLSSNEEWYGENGLVEIMFNNLLTKRLFFE